jgi:hypothetical protein
MSAISLRAGKHIEVISRHARGLQAGSRLGVRDDAVVRIEDVGDTELLIDEQTDKFRFAK